jgi:hypothetical protein
MSSQYGDIDEHIERLRNGGTLTEIEVKNLCEKVRSSHPPCIDLLTKKTLFHVFL